MTDNETAQIEQRLQSLQAHLEKENPVLLQVVQSFRSLDGIAYKMGLLDRSESFATRVPWWPLVSVLGTFSSGKSTFINHYLGSKLQMTGNQAVDDKFTVVCYSDDGSSRVLPGLALDADPRFPFYQISADIEAVATGEGRRVDAYLQLKTCPSEKLRGKILIDSPGFDADAQRTSTLRITDHIVDLSDLVLVLFDARHPEPGAMHDTLQHLVADTIARPDSNKFLYILNQIDATAREDNPEEVFAAWQRALAQKGLTAGRFYRIYNPDAAIPIEDPARRARFESKRDADLAEIHGRMQQVEVERAYRIIGVLEKTAKTIEQDWVPRLEAAKSKWKKRVGWGDAVAFGLLAVALALWGAYVGGLDTVAGALLRPDLASPTGIAAFAAILGALLILAVYLHFTIRRWAARAVERQLAKEERHTPTREALVKAFRKNTRPWRSLFKTRPVGWGQRARRGIIHVLAEADGYVQVLNDRFTNPSGAASAPRQETPRVEAQQPAAETQAQQPAA